MPAFTIGGKKLQSPLCDNGHLWNTCCAMNLRSHFRILHWPGFTNHMHDPDEGFIAETEIVIIAHFEEKRLVDGLKSGMDAPVERTGG